MACRTETKEIGDHEYSVTQWSATKSMLTKFKLIKIFGATLAIIASHIGEPSKKGKPSKPDEAKSLAEGLSMLFQDNSPEEIVELMKGCIIGVACDGEKITNTSFEQLFSGDDLLEIYKIFIFVIHVNYSNLMKGQLATTLLAKVQGNL